MDSNKQRLKWGEHIQIPADQILWVGRITEKLPPAYFLLDSCRIFFTSYSWLYFLSQTVPLFEYKDLHKIVSYPLGTEIFL